jgi:hypothetical protein
MDAWNKSRVLYEEWGGLARDYANTAQTYAIEAQISALAAATPALIAADAAFSTSMSDITHNINMSTVGFTTTKEQLAAVTSALNPMLTELNHLKTIGVDVTDITKNYNSYLEQQAQLQIKLNQENLGASNLTGSMNYSYGLSGGMTSQQTFQADLASHNLSYTSSLTDMIAELNTARNATDNTALTFSDFQKLMGELGTELTDNFNTAMTSFNTNVSLGIVAADDYSGQLKMLKDDMIGLTLTTDESNQVLIKEKQLQIQINQATISNMQDQFTVANNMHSALYDTTAKQIEYYQNLYDVAKALGDTNTQLQPCLGRF